MDEDETWDALEELWREGKIDHVPGIGDVDSPQFNLTDEGVKATRELFRENDDAVLMLLSIAVKDQVARPNDESELAEVLTTFAKKLRDDAGVNAFRVIRRNPEKAPGIDAEGLPEAFVEQFDPPEDADG